MRLALDHIVLTVGESNKAGGLGADTPTLRRFYCFFAKIRINRHILVKFRLKNTYLNGCKSVLLRTQATDPSFVIRHCSIGKRLVACEIPHETDTNKRLCN